MRVLLLAASLSLALMAGCFEDDSGGPPADDSDVTPQPVNATAPAPLHFENDVPLGADPFNQATQEICSTPASTCFYHDFDVPNQTTVDLVATLAWTLPANDFDLYLFQGATELSRDGINSLGAVEVPPTTQVLHHPGLIPGTYTFVVVAWNSVADGYTLDAEFTLA